MSGIAMILVYVVIIGGFYLIAIRPQKKREKAHQALVDSVEVGDSILTTSGFYGVVIDMTDEVVIVEFGNNKNCRIPMKKENIVLKETDWNSQKDYTDLYSLMNTEEGIREIFGGRNDRLMTASNSWLIKANDNNIGFINLVTEKANYNFLFFIFC